MKEILGLGDCGRKMTDITKKYLATIWRKRKLNKKGQKNNRAENKNIKNLETGKHGDRLSIYLGRFPQFGGVADNTKETNKNNGGFTPFFQQ